MSENLPEPIATDSLEHLSAQEANDLAGLEATIARAVKTAGKIAGEALREIRERRLYRSSHRSWEAYVLDRCGFSVRTANRMIAAADEKALEAETGHAVPHLPGTTRAGRRSRPAPQPSQAEVLRQRKERQETPAPADVEELEASPPVPTTTAEPTPVERLMQPQPSQLDQARSIASWMGKHDGRRVGTSLSEKEWTAILNWVAEAKEARRKAAVAGREYREPNFRGK